MIEPSEIPAEPEPTPVGSNVYEDPQIQETLKAIADLKEQMARFSEKLEPFDEAMKSAKVTHQAIVDEFRKKEAESNAYQSQLRREKYDIEVTLENIKRQLPTLQGKIDDRVRELTTQQEFEELEGRWRSIMESTAWKELIKDYQLKGAKFMAARHRVLNGDDMGLGKTLMFAAAKELTDIEFIDRPLQDRATLFITKAKATHSALKELRKWIPEQPMIVLEGNQDAREFQAELAYNSGLILIAGYEGVRSTEKINDFPWARVCTDEAHKYKNMDTKIWKAIARVSRDAEYFWQMTATPLVNSPKDTFSLLAILRPDVFKHWYRFQNEYCSVYGYRGSEVTWRGNGADRLLKDIQDFAFRRLKKDVLTDLPDKTPVEHLVQLEGRQAELYSMMRDKFVMWLDGEEKEQIEATSVLAQFMRLRQLALWPPSIKKKVLPTGDVEGGEEEFEGEGPIIQYDDEGNIMLEEMAVDCHESAKIDECMDIIEELHEAGEKCVVFSVLNPPLLEVMRRCEAKGISSIIIKGGVSAKKASNIQDDFQEKDDPWVLCGNIKAMGETYTLHRANHAIFLDRWWNAATNEQAEDRLYRIGQKSNVTVHRILAENSIDQFIEEKIAGKQNMFNSVFNRQELRDAVERGLI